MTMRTKPSLLAAALVAALAMPLLVGPMLSASALAQGGMMPGGMMQGQRGPGMMQRGDGDWGPMMGRMGGMPGTMMGAAGRHMAGRLAFIEAELEITEDQRPLWNAFETAARDAMGTMGAMHDRIQAMDEPPPLPERLALMEEMMASHLSALQSVRDEATALYEALSPAQKETADSIMGMGMM